MDKCWVTLQQLEPRVVKTRPEVDKKRKYNMQEEKEDERGKGGTKP